ncbi:MAG: hypothetical protein ACHQM6_05625 [Candidatus Kapaibacterium sp.]
MKARIALGLGMMAMGLALGMSTPVIAQNFREGEEQWKSETIRAKSVDTIRIEKHSFFSLPALSDTTPLVYHEPMPDSVMPKAAIEIGLITIQAGNAEDVVSMLETQARKAGADWIVGFNEPRMKITKGEVYYRSQAMLYKVINPELVPESDIVEISCGENHLQNCAAVENFVKHTVAKSGE